MAFFRYSVHVFSFEMEDASFKVLACLLDGVGLSVGWC